ncbi:MAG: serine hydrolase [Candidatus Latescibacteria bacterium]|nr:serine hydrolase [Candidatus Latescibacterota bacterium]NIO56544.1 serine hydrolase [Candidatus Latescibacterota bacterium]
MKGKLAWLPLVLIALLVHNSVLAQDKPPLFVDEDTAAIVSELNTSIPALMEKGRVPGLQIALIRDGKIVWEKELGIKNTVSREPVTSETIFEAASLTKPFFAYAVMRLVEEGVLDLDTPLVQYLPRELIEEEMGHSLDLEGFRRDWFEKITARHVLSHTGGMPHGERGTPYPLSFEPGTNYKYSADGYYFLQKAIEFLKKQKLEFIMDAYVLEPLGMTKSSMVWQDSYENTMANGHDAYGTPQDFRKRTEAHAGASLYTTAADYGRFVCAMLNGEGLAENTVKEMLARVIDVDKDMGIGWSLGFGLQTDTNGTAFWQWGDYGIFRNYILAYPEHKIAVVYLANSFYGLGICQELVAHSIGGRALGAESLKYLQYDSPICTFAWAVIDQGPQAVDELLPTMYAKHPDLLSDRAIGMISYFFTEGERFDELIAFYSFVVEKKPESATAASGLARAYLEKGDFANAKANYEKAKEAENKEDFDPNTVDWALSYIEALEQLMSPSSDYLKTLAGDYETRHIKFEDGKLFYIREDAAAKDYRELIPMSKDTFVMRELIYFRLRFDFDDTGAPHRVTGIYEWGQEDHSTRDK